MDELTNLRARNKWNQKRRRQRSLRIDYVPGPVARQVIETAHAQHGGTLSLREFLDTAIVAWNRSFNLASASCEERTEVAGKSAVSLAGELDNVANRSGDRKPVKKYCWR